MTYNCDDHSLGFPMDEPCVFCRDEANGISDMSTEFAKFEQGGSIINGVTTLWSPQPEGGLHGG